MRYRGSGCALTAVLLLAGVGIFSLASTAPAQNTGFRGGVTATAHNLVDLIDQATTEGRARSDVKHLRNALNQLLHVLEKNGHGKKGSMGKGMAMASASASSSAKADGGATMSWASSSNKASAGLDTTDNARSFANVRSLAPANNVARKPQGSAGNNKGRDCHANKPTNNNTAANAKNVVNNRPANNANNHAGLNAKSNGKNTASANNVARNQSCGSQTGKQAFVKAHASVGAAPAGKKVGGNNGANQLPARNNRGPVVSANGNSTNNGNAKKGGPIASANGNALNTGNAKNSGLTLNNVRSKNTISNAPANNLAANFPNLGNHKVLDASNKNYNCIAHTLGSNNQWISPRTGPAKAPLAPMDKLYSANGFQRQPGLDLRPDPNAQKVALYATKNPDGSIKKVTHAALQQPNGVWSSKLGKLPLVQHSSANSVAGRAYGVPVATYARPLAGNSVGQMQHGNRAACQRKR